MIEESLYEFIAILSVLCAIGSLLLFKKSNAIEKSFHYYIMMKAFFEVLAIALGLLIGNNLFGLHIYTVMQFAILTLFFKNCFEIFNIEFKYYLILVIGLCLIIANSLFIQPIDTYNSYTRFLVELYMIIACIYMFVLLIRNRKYDRGYMKASVTFISTVFLEASGSLIFYLYSNVIIEMESIYSHILFSIRLGLNYIVLFLIIYGLYQIFMNGKSKLKLDQ